MAVSMCDRTTLEGKDAPGKVAYLCCKALTPAGGIRTAKQALAYLVMVKETLGDDCLTSDLFRFGASTLVNDVLMQIAKTVDGNY